MAKNICSNGTVKDYETARKAIRYSVNMFIKMHFPFHFFKPDPLWIPLSGNGILFRNRQNLKPSNLKTIEIWKRSHRANKYTLKVRNGNTRRRWEICSQLTIKTPELRHRPHSNVFIVIFTYLTRRCSVYILDLNR